MTINYRKLNQEVALIAAFTSDVLTLLGQITVASGTQYENLEQFTFMWNGKQYKFIVSFQGYRNPPDKRDMDNLGTPQSITPIVYIDDVMIIGPDKNDWASTLVSWYDTCS